MGIGYGLTALAGGLANAGSQMVQGRQQGLMQALALHAQQQQLALAQQHAQDQHAAAAGGLYQQGVTRGADPMGADDAVADLGGGIYGHRALNPNVIKGQNALTLQGVKNDGTANVAQIKGTTAENVQGQKSATAVQTTGMKGATARDVAGIGANARVQSAGIGANARLGAAQIGATAGVQRAQIGADGGIARARVTSEGRLQSARARMEMTARQQFAHDEDIHRASEMARAYQQATAAVQAADGGNGLADPQLLDAIGSIGHTGVVRKTDKSFNVDAQGPYGKFATAINRVAGGNGTFDPETRHQMYAIAQEIVRQQGAASAERTARERDFATSNGLNPAYAVDPLERLLGGAPVATPAAPAPSRTATAARPAGPLAAFRQQQRAGAAPTGPTHAGTSAPSLSAADRAHAQRDPAFAAWLRQQGYRP